MNILVINAGSSSLKYQLIDMDTHDVMAKGIIERIGLDISKLTHKNGSGKSLEKEGQIATHIDAIKTMLDVLTDSQYGAIRSMADIHAVGHRVVHGGESFKDSVLIDGNVIERIREIIDLAPLHNPANLMGIEACRAVLPDVPMVAVFDTAFHQSVPPVAYMYGLPYEYYERLRVRRYGFHGTSHGYVSKQAAKFLGKPVEQLKIVTCHLGNGASIAAVKGGKSIDTSMGLTPLEGLMMGTRCGDIDTAAVELLMQKDGLSIEEVIDIMNKKSGLVGISGVSSDMRDIMASISQGNERAKLAASMFSYRVRKYIGAYAAIMGGIDCIVFTAGIGENMPPIRAMVLEDLDWLGARLDPERNKQREEIYRISTDDSTLDVLVVATNEELMIAEDTLRLAGG